VERLISELSVFVNVRVTFAAGLEVNAAANNAALRDGSSKTIKLVGRRIMPGSVSSAASQAANNGNGSSSNHNRRTGIPFNAVKALENKMIRFNGEKRFKKLINRPHSNCVILCNLKPPL